MEIRYTRNGIDINYISCLYSEIEEALSALQKNYSCVDIVTIDIKDINKTLYICYLGYSGRRCITIYRCHTIYDIEYLIYHSRSNKGKYLIDEFKSKRTLKCIEKLINHEQTL